MLAETELERQYFAILAKKIIKANTFLRIKEYVLVYTIKIDSLVNKREVVMLARSLSKRAVSPLAGSPARFSPVLVPRTLGPVRQIHRTIPADGQIAQTFYAFTGTSLDFMLPKWNFVDPDSHEYKDQRRADLNEAMLEVLPELTCPEAVAAARRTRKLNAIQDYMGEGLGNETHKGKVIIKGFVDQLLEVEAAYKKNPCRIHIHSVVAGTHVSLMDAFHREDQYSGVFMHGAGAGLYLTTKASLHFGSTFFSTGYSATPAAKAEDTDAEPGPEQEKEKTKTNGPK